jgi:hypothetical protein
VTALQWFQIKGLALSSDGPFYGKIHILPPHVRCNFAVRITHSMQAAQASDRREGLLEQL